VWWSNKFIEDSSLCRDSKYLGKGPRNLTYYGMVKGKAQAYSITIMSGVADSTIIQDNS
jgi:hypothetical protein